MALKTYLVSHLKFDEAAADNARADSYGEIHMQQNSSPPSTTGKVGNGITLAAPDYLTPFSNAASVWSPGDTDFATGCWVKLGTLTGTTQALFGKYNTSGNQREWFLQYDHASSKFGIMVSSNGSATASVLANTFGAVSTGVWYYVFAYHDSVNNVIGVSINAGTRDTTAHSAGVFQGTAPVRIGQITGILPMNGDLDELSFWSGGIPSTGDVATIYNGGAGLDFDLWDVTPDGGSGPYNPFRSPVFGGGFRS